MKIVSVDLPNENLIDSNDSSIKKIKHKYARIDSDWLMFHYHLAIALIIFSFVTEVLIGLFLISSDMLNTSIIIYCLKYLVIPSLINFISIGVTAYIIKQKRFSQSFKAYVVSLTMVLSCFVLYTVHSTFTSVFFIFAIAILLTTIYANYQLTALTIIFSFIGIIGSELFIYWDLDKINILKSTERFSNFIIALLILIAFSSVIMIIIHFEQQKYKVSIAIEQERSLLQQRIQVDELTGLLNRKGLHQALKEVEENGEDKYILAVADLNGFKQTNDDYGHLIGDKVLVEFAKILREHDQNLTSYRYGGDEFCLLFKGYDQDSVIAICEAINDKRKLIKLPEHDDLKISVSFGIASYQNENDSVKLFIQADQALYEAKSSMDTYRIYKPKMATS